MLQARGGAVAAEALEVLAAGRETGVQVVRRDGAAAALAALAVERRSAPRAGHAAPRDARRRCRSRPRASPRPRPRARDRRARSRRCAAISAAAARRIVSSTCWRSRLRSSICSASGWASLREGASSRSSASVGSPSRPAALMRGASRKLRSDVRRRAGSTPALDISARRPGRSASASRRRPRADERAVLVGERHDVGDRRQRDEVGELVERRRQGRRIAAVAARPQRLRELEDDARAAQVRERIAPRRAGARDATIGASGSTSPGR